MCVCVCVCVCVCTQTHVGERIIAPPIPYFAIGKV